MAATLMISCNQQDDQAKTKSKNIINENHLNSDSIELTNLTKEVYKWHLTKKLSDFPYKFGDQQDSIFIGIDWEKYQSSIKLFQSTNFFTDDFLLKHRNIALSLDSSIKKADTTWRNINEGIPIWDTNADDWCSCQDYVDDYWQNITISSLTIKDKYANFSWTWEKEIKSDSYLYLLTAKKEDGKWRINSLDGFKYYYSVAHYDKLMQE